MTAFASIVLAAQPGLGAKSGVDGVATVDGKGADSVFEALVANLTGPALLFVGETAAFSAAQPDVRTEAAA
jgi:hypothetical protein